MLDAIAGEHADAAVVHADGEVDGQFALGRAQDGAHRRVEMEAVGGGLELRQGDVIGVGTLHFVVHGGVSSSALRL